MKNYTEEELFELLSDGDVLLLKKTDKEQSYEVHKFKYMPQEDNYVVLVIRRGNQLIFRDGRIVVSNNTDNGRCCKA